MLLMLLQLLLLLLLVVAVVVAVDVGVVAARIDSSSILRILEKSKGVRFYMVKYL